MSDDSPISVEDFESYYSPLADTAIVIISTTILEDWITIAIKTKMRSISNTVHERIFSGYGPLSTFSAKIDIGYALNLYDEKILRDLRALKDIRNTFAHTTMPHFFKSPHVVSDFQKLTGWEKDIHPHQLFRNSVNACVDALKVSLQNKAMIDALMGFHGEGGTKERPLTLLEEFGRPYLHHKSPDQDDSNTDGEDPP